MLGRGLIFFALAITAAILGFGDISGAAAGTAQALSFVFLALLVISFIARSVRRQSATQ